MLTLHLTLTNDQVSVYVNEKESHQFSLLDLSQSKEEWKDFFDNPRIYGEKLFNALFKNTARMEFATLSKQTERTIMLVLESPDLDGVTWEYAYNKAKEEYVVEDCAFVRVLPEKERAANGRLKNEVKRVPLLFIPANPLVDLSGEPMRALDVEGEWREIKRHIEKSNAPFDMIELRPATPEALQSVMARFQNGMIAHFSGHGAITKDGAILLFERENGASNPLEAREFVREIKDKAWIGFLSACQSAVPERTEYSNLARELARAGVPFALGMQFNLPDPFAPNISGQFYNYLAHAHAVPAAARQARRAVKRENEFFVGMIALYAAHPDEAGKLVWRGAGAKTHDLFRPADVRDLPSPASGLIGRQRELMRIGTRLLEDKKPLTLTLHGAGGIGKTALLWQALLRFAPSFELTLAIGLDPLPSLESVLGRIEHFLGLPSPCANDTQEREALARNALTSKHTLLGLDNFETLNHALNDDATKGTSKSLYAFFKSLPAEGVTLCVTSREKTNLPGEHIEEIYGLEDAMGGALFYESVSTRKDALNETGLEKLSAAIGGHPLALRLLAPIFEEQAGLSLGQFIEKLQTFLPKASDRWTEEERHASLGACFAFSMDNLPKTEEGEKLQVAISRLSVFTAFFVDFTAAPVLESKMFETGEEILAMRERSRNTLNALWERGLLERIAVPLEEENFYLYRIHLALRIFASERLIDTDTVNDMYWKSMSYLARLAEEQLNKNPLVLRIAMHAMSDLFAISESKGDKEAALMQNRVGALCLHFGLIDDALRLFNGSLNAFERLNDLQGKSGVLHNLANIHVAHGDLDEAMNLCQQALEISETLGDLRGKSASLQLLAGIFFTRGNSERAMRLYKQAIEIAETIDNEELKSVALANMIRIFVRNGNLDEALKLHHQSLEIQENMGDLRGKSKTIHNIARIYVTRGDFDKAMLLFEQSLIIKEELGDLSGQAATIGEMGVIYFRRGNLNKALDLFEQKLAIAQGLGDKRETAIALHNIAMVYEKRGDVDLAMDLYQQSLDLKESLGDLEEKSVTLNVMASNYLARGELDRAIKFYAQSLEIAEAMGDMIHKAAALNNMGVALVRKNHYAEGLKSLLSALEIRVQLQVKPDIKNTVSLVNQIKQAMGIEAFQILWEEVTGNASLPDWLAQNSEQEQSVIEQFIVDAIKSAREKRPEAEEYFKSAREMAADSSVTAELRELGRVLSRILAGNMKVDLSALTPELAEMVRKELDRD